MSSSEQMTGAVSVVSVGSLGSRPYNRKKGDSIVELCMLAWYANSTYDRLVSQSRTPFSVVLVSIPVRVRLKCSTNPSVWGWYAVVLTFFIPITVHNSLNKLERKAAPRSESNREGTPCRLTNCSTNKRAIVKAVWSGTANTSGHLVR